MAQHSEITFSRWRFRILAILLCIIVVIIAARMIYLSVFNRPFLLKEGNARSIRTTKTIAYRGMILDRDHTPLAVSTPVYSIWVNPKDFPATAENINSISCLLETSVAHIQAVLKKNPNREFAYIKRSARPEVSKKVQSLGLPGIYLERAYRRYYPEGEVSAHVVGFTNIDDDGQEGLELAYNKWLKGEPGKERVLKDRYGKVVAVLATVKESKPGQDLVLSLNSRIQYLAYHVLKSAVKEFQAKSGSVVVLNPKTGEILATVNFPSYNPNNRSKYNSARFRNRAITDVFELGSTMKAFSVASALDSGKYRSSTLINTNPGWFMIGKNQVKEDRINRGVIDVMQVLKYSSNVGVAKMILSLPPEHFIGFLERVGFGERSQSGFPGEGTGSLSSRAYFRPFVLATLAFGYGLSATPLQLAQAYGVIGNDGLKCPITFLKQEEVPHCQRVMEARVAHEMRTMLESVVQEGTGRRAKVSNYRIAGKTGTAYIAESGGYNKERYIASFVGMAPVTDPQLVVAVIIQEPQNNHYGAVVAAPAFAKIMGPALHMLNIPPDQE